MVMHEATQSPRPWLRRPSHQPRCLWLSEAKHLQEPGWSQGRVEARCIRRTFPSVKEQSTLGPWELIWEALAACWDNLTLCRLARQRASQEIDAVGSESAVLCTSTQKKTYTSTPLWSYLSSSRQWSFMVIMCKTYENLAHLWATWTNLRIDMTLTWSRSGNASNESMSKRLCLDTSPTIKLKSSKLHLPRENIIILGIPLDVGWV